MVKDELLHRDAVAVDAGLAAACTWGAHNPRTVKRRAARRLASLSLNRRRFPIRHVTGKQACRPPENKEYGQPS